MALVKTEELISQSRGFNNLGWLRQIGLMVGLAASVAIGVAAVLWSQTPDYRLLYSNLSTQDATEIAQALQQATIPYQLSADESAVMVPEKHIHDARIKLAGQGLPRGSGVGFELLDKQQTFGVSQFMENARYQHALEGELARTIASINSVRGARVHLAIPKRTVFVRKRSKPTASITVDLYAGRTLSEEQVAAIGHMVAASIPDMDVSQVTIIDQRGHLLTTPEGSNDMRLTALHFAYRKRVEDYYIKRIEDLLTPIMGAGAVRAQVSAVIDNTVTEQTRESYNPDDPAIRSEQTMEEKTTGELPAGGIPGSVSNQPDSQLGQKEATPVPSAQPGSSSRKVTRNYELDKTISHTRATGGNIRRLSVAVALDNKTTVNEDGETIRTPLSSDEITRITGLIKEAVGFNTLRGDRINVINTAFAVPPTPEALPEPSMFAGENLWNLIKQVLVVALVGFLVFGVLKPVMRDLAAKGKALPAAGGNAGQFPGAIAEDQLSLSDQSVPRLPGATGTGSYDTNLNTAQTLAAQDPKRVAQVVNNWVASE